MTDTPSVLFVCLGNICRSPLAAAAFRDAAARAGIDVVVDSAGTGRWHIDEPPDPRPRAVARVRGLDIRGCRGRQVEPADFHRFDHVVALDHDNLVRLEALRPHGARAEPSLLLDHVPSRRGEPVANPYHGDERGFDATWADVTAGAAALLRTLRGAG